MAAQLLVPLGQAHWRFSRKERASAARRKRSHECGGDGPSSSNSGPERRAKGGRRGSSADELAQMRRASSISRALRAAIAARGFGSWAGAKVEGSEGSAKAPYSWWNFAPWSGGILRTAVGRRCWDCGSAWASRASICAATRSHSESGSGRISWVGVDAGVGRAVYAGCRFFSFFLSFLIYFGMLFEMIDPKLLVVGCRVSVVGCHFRSSIVSRRVFGPRVRGVRS